MSWEAILTTGLWTLVPAVWALGLAIAQLAQGQAVGAVTGTEHEMRRTGLRAAQLIAAVSAVFLLVAAPATGGALTAATSELRGAAGR